MILLPFFVLEKMETLLTQADLERFFTVHPSTRSVVGAIYTIITGRHVGPEERETLTEIEGLDDLAVIAGFFQRLGVPDDQMETTLTTYHAALGGQVSSQETIGITFSKLGYHSAARFWWTRAVRGKSKMAEFELAVLFMTGKGGPMDPMRAKTIFEKFTKDPAKKFRSKAWYNLGLFYSIQKSPGLMEECFCEAAKLGNLNAVRRMGDHHYDRKEFEKAREMYQKLHDLGDPDGTFRLARFAENPQDAFRMVVMASNAGSWRSKVCVAYRILSGRSTVTDFRQVQKLLDQAYPKIPTTHGIKHQVLNLLWYLETFGDGTDPDEGPGILEPHVLAGIMDGKFPPLPKPRTLEDDALWFRDNLDFVQGRMLFDVAAHADGQDSPRVHFNLAMMCCHGLGSSTGEVDPAKALYHFNRYIQLTEPSYMHTHVLAVMDCLVKTLVEDPGAIPMLKEMGFVE